MVDELELVEALREMGVEIAFDTKKDIQNKIDMLKVALLILEQKERRVNG